MSDKGGRTATTWAAGSSWKTDCGKKMKTIRVPEAIADEVMRCAREIDADNAVSHGITEDRREIVLSAIAAYIEMRKSSRHNNQHNQGKELDTTIRTWDEMRKFAKLVEEHPERLGI